MPTDPATLSVDGGSLCVSCSNNLDGKLPSCWLRANYLQEEGYPPNDPSDQVNYALGHVTRCTDYTAALIKTVTPQTTPAVATATLAYVSAADVADLKIRAVVQRATANDYSVITDITKYVDEPVGGSPGPGDGNYAVTFEPGFTTAPATFKQVGSVADWAASVQAAPAPTTTSFAILAAHAVDVSIGDTVLDTASNTFSTVTDIELDVGSGHYVVTLADVITLPVTNDVVLGNPGNAPTGDLQTGAPSVDLDELVEPEDEYQLATDIPDEDNSTPVPALDATIDAQPDLDFPDPVSS